MKLILTSLCQFGSFEHVAAFFLLFPPCDSLFLATVWKAEQKLYMLWK